MREKIDFVITWVDGNDEKWLNEKMKYEKECSNSNSLEFKQWINAKSRYRDWDILKYWFRSVEKYAPWVNKIYFVTYGHIPKWLNVDNPKIVVVNHKDYIPKKYLPTYNSNVIELNVHRIKNLSDNFVLFNDDMFINDYVNPTDFFNNGKPCEVAGFEVVRTDPLVTNADINNMKILNKYFSKEEVLKKNRKKWYKLSYGKYLLKTILLKPWREITGIAEMHVMCSYNKKNFEWLWKNEYEKCDETSKYKFRNIQNINHWVVKGYQLLNGDFYPRKGNFGVSYGKPIDEEIVNDILYHKHKAICINDFECTEKEFEDNKNRLIEAFEKVLPEKSSFEK